MATAEEIAWAAGLFDGEGTFYIAREEPKSYRKDVTVKYSARMKMGMCHEGAVRKFTDIVQCGSVSIEHKPTENANFSQYRWNVSGQQAINVARMLYPYLVVKQHEAAILFRWEPLIADGRKIFITPEMLEARESLYWELRKAKTSLLTPVPSLY